MMFYDIYIYLIFYHYKCHAIVRFAPLLKKKKVFFFLHSCQMQGWREEKPGSQVSHCFCCFLPVIECTATFSTKVKVQHSYIKVMVRAFGFYVMGAACSVEEPE